MTKCERHLIIGDTVRRINLKSPLFEIRINLKSPLFEIRINLKSHLFEINSAHYVPDNYVALRFADQHVTIDGVDMATRHCISDATRFHKPSSNEVNSMPRTRGIPLVAVTGERSRRSGETR